MNVLPSTDRQHQETAFYLATASELLYRYLARPDEHSKANLNRVLDDYANAVRRGDCQPPILPR